MDDPKIVDGSSPLESHEGNQRADHDKACQQQENMAAYDKARGIEISSSDFATTVCHLPQEVTIKIRETIASTSETVGQIGKFEVMKAFEGAKLSLIQDVEKNLREIYHNPQHLDFSQVSEFVVKVAQEQTQSIFENVYMPRTQAALVDMNVRVEQSLERFMSKINENIQIQVRDCIQKSIDERMSELENQFSRKTEICMERMFAENRRFLDCAMTSLNQYQSQKQQSQIEYLKQLIATTQVVPQQNAVQQIRDSISRDLACCDYLSAFKKELSLRDPQGLIIICQACHLTKALEVLRTDQNLLLSLLHWLSIDISQNLGVKIPWLVEAIRVLDLRGPDAKLQGNIVLTDIKRKIHSLKNEESVFFSHGLYTLRFLVEDYLSRS